MYEAFYGMRERPFTLTPDPSFLFMSSKHALALSMLEYTLTGQAGFTVVTGEIGSGKTTLIRHFLKRAKRGINLGVVSNTHAAFGDLLQWVHLAFGIQSGAIDKAGRYQAFASYLVSQFAAGKQTILIVDEAQNLSIDALEELRLLSNINEGRDQLIQTILVGQPELLEKLRRPELAQFAQRISVHYHLSPLSNLETRDYILHRLQIAGVTRQIFDAPAIAAIFHFSNGVPRLINSLCDAALVYGFAQNKSEIDIDIVQLVVRDRERGSLLPLPVRSSDVTREDVIKSASVLSAPSVLSPANDIGQPSAEVTSVTAAPLTDRREDAVSVPSAGIANQERHLEDITAYVQREVERLATPIMPAYLDDDLRQGAGGTSSHRKIRSRWFWWLT